MNWAGGSPALVDDTRALLQDRQFVEGNHGEPGQFVVERAFAERLIFGGPPLLGYLWAPIGAS